MLSEACLSPAEPATCIIDFVNAIIRYDDGVVIVEIGYCQLATAWFVGGREEEGGGAWTTTSFRFLFGEEGGV